MRFLKYHISEKIVAFSLFVT